MRRLKRTADRILRDLREYGWVLAVFLMLYFLFHAVFGVFCPQLLLTGFPCAGCGMTRAFLFLLKGQVKRAAYVNPSVFPFICFLLYCGFCRYIKGSRIRGLKILLLLLLGSMLVIYGYRMYLYFPDRVPYVYEKKNLAARQLPGYEYQVHKMLKSIRKWRAGR